MIAVETPALSDSPKALSDVVRLGDVLEVIRGASPRPKGDPKYFGGDIPWVMISDLKREPGKYLSQTRETVTKAGADKSRYLAAGTLILSNSGTVCVPKILAVDGCIHDGFVAFPSIPSAIDKRYLYWFFEYIRPAIIEANRQGITQVNLNTSIVKDIRFPLVRIDTQRRIVAEIEKQFSRLDEAVANLKRVKANLKRYKAAVLKAAVEGRLVPTEAELARREGRQYETGTQLLQRILETRYGRWNGRGKYKVPIGVELSQTVGAPEGWTIASLDQLASKITSGSRDWSPYYNRGTSTFVLAQNVRPLAPDFSVRQFVDPPKDDPSRDRSRVEPGDLLATIVGANTGQVCLISAAPDDAYVCQSVALIRPAESGVSAYLNYWLNSEEHGRRYFERCMYGQGRPHLSFEQLMTAPIALPPGAEQQRIVAEVDRRLSFVREVESQVEANLKRADRLRQATLGKAFASLGEKGQ
ncbi:MAG: restriction endonuclease subunit S [Betaproteobacteria bacterium]